MRVRAAAFVAIVAVTALCGCEGSPPLAGPWGAGASAWMQARAKSSDLLYVATGDNVFMLSYPKGELVGSLGVSGNNLCSDKHGNVFVPDGYSVLEYAHGSTSPSQTLAAGDIALGCAVDPRTGNLAVTQEGSGAGEVAIFPDAKAPSTWYRDPAIATFGLCGYDDRGNLFVDGTGSENELAELRRGASEFTNFALRSKFVAFGDVAWDGTYVTLSNPATRVLYRLTFKGGSYRVAGATRIKWWKNAYSGHWPYTQTLLTERAFFAQSASTANVGRWPYPAGGPADAVLGPFESGEVTISGVALSAAQR